MNREKVIKALQSHDLTASEHRDTLINMLDMLYLAADDFFDGQNSSDEALTIVELAN